MAAALMRKMEDVEVVSSLMSKLEVKLAAASSSDFSFSSSSTDSSSGSTDSSSLDSSGDSQSIESPPQRCDQLKVSRDEDEKEPQRWLPPDWKPSGGYERIFDPQLPGLAFIPDDLEDGKEPWCRYYPTWKEVPKTAPVSEEKARNMSEYERLGIETYNQDVRKWWETYLVYASCPLKELKEDHDGAMKKMALQTCWAMLDACYEDGYFYDYAAKYKKALQDGRVSHPGICERWNFSSRPPASSDEEDEEDEEEDEEDEEEESPSSP